MHTNYDNTEPQVPPKGKYITLAEAAEWLRTGIEPKERTWKQRQKEGTDA